MRNTKTLGKFSYMELAPLMEASSRSQSGWEWTGFFELRERGYWEAPDGFWRGNGFRIAISPEQSFWRLSNAKGSMKELGAVAEAALDSLLARVREAEGYVHCVHVAPGVFREIECWEWEIDIPALARKHSVYLIESPDEVLKATSDFTGKIGAAVFREEQAKREADVAAGKAVWESEGMTIRYLTT